VGYWYTLAVLATLALLGAPGLTHAHGDLHRQIADATARVEREPDRAALYLRRGELHRAHRDWAAALADYDRAAALDPALAAVDLGRAAVWLEIDRPAEALESAERHAGALPEARLLRARALARLGRAAEAADEWGRAIAALARPRPDHFVARAQALADAGRPEEALASLDEGIERLGPVVSLDLPAIELELRLSRVDTALARVERQAAASPRKETWLLRRGEILEGAGRAGEARIAYAAALRALEATPVARRHTRAMEEVRERSTAGLARTSGAARIPTPGDR
jgi:tetratricopeptide (TPR) repeat protein